MHQRTRTCPPCGSGAYTFRGRKKVAADPDKGEGPARETRYRGKACAMEWTVRTPA